MKLTKKTRRRILKIIFIISIIIANCYWENSEMVELAFNTARPTSQEYDMLTQYATEIAKTGDTSIISEEELQVDIKDGEKHTLIVTIQNEKCIVTVHFKSKEKFQILQDGTVIVEKSVEEQPLKIIGNSKLPSKKSCICTAIFVWLASFTAIYFLCYNIPRRLINQQVEKVLNDF